MQTMPSEGVEFSSGKEFLEIPAELVNGTAEHAIFFVWH